MKLYYFLIAFFLLPNLKAQKNKASTLFKLLGIKNENCSFSNNAVSYSIEGSKMDVAANPNEINKDKIFRDFEQYREKIKDHFLHTDFKQSPYKEVESFYQDNQNYRLLKKGDQYQLQDEKGKILFSGNFTYVEKAQRDEYGFNAYTKTNKSNYYNYKGQLVFKDKFDFVVQKAGDYFIVQNNHKTGVVNAKGVFVLEPLDGEVYPFLFRGILYFAIQANGESYFLAQGKKDKIWIPNNGSPPFIVKDRYWILNGRLYDMDLQKQLFCNINSPIEIANTQRGLFQINVEANDLKTIFDVSGNIVFEQELVLSYSINKDQSIAWIKDTKTENSYGNISYKYGIVDLNSFKWSLAPVYNELRLLGNNRIQFTTDKNKELSGLMDTKGKIIIEPGKFTFFNTTPDKKYILCTNKESAYLLNSSNKLLPLKTNYNWIESSGHPDFYIAVYKKANETLVDILSKDYKTVHAQSYAAVQYKQRLKLWECQLENGQYGMGKDDEKIYLDHNFQPFSLTINNHPYTYFKELDFVDKNRILCRLPDGTNFICTKSGAIPVNCSSASYDSFANFYITYQNGYYGITDTNGIVLLPNKFQYISTNNGTPLIHIDLDRNVDKKICIGKEGTLLFQKEYDYVDALSNNFFIVGKDKKFGLADADNHLKLDIIYDYMYTNYGFLHYGFRGGSKQYLPISNFKK